MFLGEKGKGLQERFKINVNLSETKKILEKYLLEKQKKRLDQNQIDALILLVSYIGEERFAKSIVLKAIINVTDEDIKESYELSKEEEPRLYKQAGWNFAYEGRMFAEDMMEGQYIGEEFGKLFNTPNKTKKI
jgi:hypothetical protein